MRPAKLSSPHEYPVNKDSLFQKPIEALNFDTRLKLPLTLLLYAFVPFQLEDQFVNLLIAGLALFRL